MRWLFVFAFATLFAQVPNPNSLPSDFRTYFDVKGEELQKRVNLTIESLDQLVQGADPELQVEAEPLVQRIATNLETLVALAGREVAPIAAPQVIKESYTPAELIALSDEFLSVKAGIASNLAKQKGVEERIGVHKGLYQRIWLEYQEQESGVEHLLTGLELLAEASYISVLEQRLRLSKEEIKNLEQQLGFLQKELDAATWRVTGTPEQTELYKSNISQAQEAHQLALGQLSQDGEGVDVDGLVAAKEAVARATLIFHQVSFALHQVATRDLDTAALEQIGEEIIVWTGEISQLDELAETLSPSMPAETIESLQELERQVGRTQTLLTQLQQLVGTKLAENGDWWNSVTNPISQGWRAMRQAMSVTLFAIGDLPITLFGIFKALLTLLIGFCIAYVLGLWIGYLGRKKRGHSAGTVYILKRVTRYVVMTITIIIALIVLGLELGKIALIAGALAVGIGFGLKELVANIAAGLTILLGRKLRVGDYLETPSGYWGTIRDINLQNTILHTFEGMDIVIPNSHILNTEMINWTLRDPFRRLHVPFSVAYGTDKQKVAQAAKEAADRVYLTIKDHPHLPSPEARLVQFGDNGLHFELVVWINQREAKRYGGVIAKYLWEIEQSLRDHGITVPFPQRDLHFVSPLRTTEPKV